jgi:hypothetical protein
MRTLLALVLCLTACAAPGEGNPTAAPPPEPAETPTTITKKPAEPDPEDVGGFADPKHTEDPAPAPAQPVDPELDARIKQRFGDNCRYERSCGDMIGVDCNAAADGPYYYVQRTDLKTVATCGGACMGGRCTDCPPKAWTCPTY